MTEAFHSKHMTTPSLRGIEAFIKAVEGGSIAAAGRQLGLSAAAASQSIARLEAELGTRLLRRSTRSLALTDEGQIYFERVRPVLGVLEDAHGEIGALRGEPQGRFKVACSVAFGRHVLGPWITGFMQRYPRLNVELLVVDRQVDFMHENVDASIRYQHMLEPGLVARRIASAPIHYCASPAYLNRHGQPATLEDLARHRCLAYRMAMDGRIMPWPFIRDGLRIEAAFEPSLTCSDIDTLAQACLAGAGIARLGSFVSNPLIESGELIPLFTEPGTHKGAEQAHAHAAPEPLEFFVCYRDRQHVPPKLRLFIDELSEALSDHPGLRMPRCPGAPRPPIS